MKRSVIYQRYNNQFRPNPLSKNQRIKTLERVSNRIDKMTDEEREKLVSENPELKEIVDAVLALRK